MTRRTLAAAALVLATGCGGGSPAPAAADCPPPQGELPVALRAEALAGEYRLTLVAATGARQGSAVAGTLRLRPYGATPSPQLADDALHTVYGSTDLRIARVGAVAPGDVGSADPAAPGVLSVEWPRPTGPYGAYAIAFRLGADGNAEDRLRFDGSSLALFVSTADADGFAGRWESGAGMPVAAGHFCAERLGERTAGP